MRHSKIKEIDEGLSVNVKVAIINTNPITTVVMKRKHVKWSFVLPKDHGKGGRQSEWVEERDRWLFIVNLALKL